MNQLNDPWFDAIMVTLRKVWNETDDERQEWLLRELEAMIHRYQEAQRGA